jgi:hypothetical protein
MIISIDLSLRSTGVCALGPNGTLEDFTLITPEETHEDLLCGISDEILEFISACRHTTGFVPTRGFVIEGLSFNSFSSSKDVIAGNFWNLRCDLFRFYPSVPIGIIPVTSWRSWLLTKEEQKEAKLDKKDGLKKACVAKLPDGVRKQFEGYLYTREFPESLRKNKDHQEKALYDLTDAYFIGKYRQTLS